MSTDMPPDKLTPVFKQIALVIGLMITVFGVLQLVLPTSLVQPIGTIAAGFILTSALVLAGKWTWNTAGITWAGTSILLIIVHLIVSQPATITGIAVKDDGTPLIGVTLILTNSSGVDQKVVTDKDGKFEVKGVPDGRYTITSSGKLVYSGAILSGWQRIFTPTVDIGSHPIQVANVPSATPSATPTVPTPTPTSTSTSTATFTNTPTSLPTNTPTITDTPTPTPTATSTSTETPIPVGALLFSENFASGTAQGFLFKTDKSSEWKIVSDRDQKVLEMKNDSSCCLSEAVFGNARWRNYRVSFRLNLKKTDLGLDNDPWQGRAYLFFRRENANIEGPCYIVAFTLSGVNLFYEDHSKNVDWTQLATRTIAFQDDTWYSIRVEAQGTKITVFRDDAVLFVTTSTHVKSGNMSLSVEHGYHAQFADVSVVALGE